MLARNRLRCTAHITKRESGDFPSGPTVKTLPSNRGSVDLIPGRGIKIPHITWCGRKKRTDIAALVQRKAKFSSTVGDLKLFP